MLNLIWFLLLTISIIVGAANENLAPVADILFNSSKDAVYTCLNLLGIMCFWTGIMNIAKKSGLISKFSKLVSPFLCNLFPNIPKGHPALASMTMNFIANMLGVGNVATPFGIKAVEQLDKLNANKKETTKEMTMFLILNASVFQIVPSTVIALRSLAGSANPTDVTFLIWMSGCISFILGILIIKIFY